MEVEAMNFMKNDEIRSRVSLIPFDFQVSFKNTSKLLKKQGSLSDKCNMKGTRKCLEVRVWTLLKEKKKHFQSKKGNYYRIDVFWKKLNR